MRKTSAVLATLSLAVLALTGCTAAPTFDGAACERAGDASGISDAITVAGDLGETTDATVYAPVRVDKTSFTDLIVGEGRALTSSTQPMVLDIAFYGGDSGEKLYESEFNGDQSRVHSIGYWAQRSPGLEKVLACATGGTRIAAVLTPKDFGDANVDGFGLAAGENVVAIIDVQDVLPAHAEGSLKFNDASGLPTVVRAPDGRPGVIVPDTEAPVSAVTQTLIEGEGDVVDESSTVVTNIMAVGWDDKKVASTTWGSEPNIGPAAKELVGATVGSQLLVVLPAGEGSPATVVVVDILGIVPAPVQ